MTNDEEGRWMEHSAYCFSFFQSLLSILRPSKQLPVRGFSVNDREEGTNSNIGSKWSEIGDAVLCLILERLSPIDYLRTQTVCLSWQSTISRLITNKHGPPSPELPLLLLNTHETNHFSFFNLSSKSVFADSSSSSETTFQNQIICYGLVQGWMIMVDEGLKDFRFGRRSVFFLNPVTKTKVYIRPTLGNQYKDYKKFIASSKPTDPNCVVVCLFHHADSLAFTFMSDDDSWTEIEGDGRIGISFVEAEIVNGKLYALTDDRLKSIIVCDLGKKPVKPQLLAKLPDTTRVSVTPEADAHFPNSNVFNVHGEVLKSLAIDTSSGELFLVYLFINSKYSSRVLHVSPPNITGSKVFKLDNIMSSEPKWIEVGNLKNRMLYVDNLESLVVSNVGVHGPEELIEENYIYFAYDFRCEKIRMEPSWEGMRIGRHCISCGSTSYYKFERPYSVNPSFPRWFIPRLDE
ncbi:hypothetical protein K1719_023139 [Acacia pycnantha]|nr:hypothetical protein K1719_023139 [Acacia pycnantha]